ncbi:MAG: TetR/AcrR family transcriptional regulator [Actinomycetota bacterium]|nr:TetR/AcrR family transcriptional regulator [Actinomycetota bacterium]
MAKPVKKRKYNSKVRQEQAEQTRTRILEAATRLFLEDGYARTSIRAIAEGAGVVPDTVYAAFGSKVRVLTALIDQRLVPDGAVASVRDRPDVQAIRTEQDQRRQLEMFAEIFTKISGDLRPVFEILRTASAVEPESAAVLKEMEAYRLQNMHIYAGWIAERGALRCHVERAGEIMWALASPDMGRKLCDELRWSQAEHAGWLAETLIRTLLPSAPDSPLE